MSRVFLSGAMAWPPVLALLVPSEAAAGAAPAVLPGYALRSTGKRCFPDLVKSDGGQAEGCVLGPLDPTTQARLAFFAGVLGQAPVPVEIPQAGAPAQAKAKVTAYQAVSAENSATSPWDQAAWADQWGVMAVMAVAEIIGHHGRVAAADLAPRLTMVLARAAARQQAASGSPATIRLSTGADAVEMIAAHTRHVGFFLLQEMQLRHPGFDGHMSVPVTREVFVATDAAIVLPYDPVRDRVLLVEQFRMGPYGRGDPRPWMLEPVAGRVDAGETPEACARRECVEEAGISLREMEKIAGYYCTPGYSTEYFHCYLGLCDLPDLQQGRGGLDSEDEDIRTHVLPFAEAMRLIGTGEADNGPLVLSLIWLERERERLRAAA